MTPNYSADCTHPSNLQFSNLGFLRSNGLCDRN